MLFIAFGTHRSGSTWIFNAIRLLAMHARLPLAASLYSDGGSEILRNIPSGTQNVVVKVHRTDHILMTLASLVETKIIISMRDPRDSVVSLFERFSISTREAVAWLSASFASLASLPTTADRLVLQYEDRFTENEATISAIAKFVGLNVSDDETGPIFDALRGDKVRQYIESWLNRSLPAKRPRDFDPATQWHPGHVGDGRIGKWEEGLPLEVSQAVSDCLDALSDASAWRSKPMRWSSRFFYYHDGRSPGDDELFECTGEERLLVWGPYFFLPAGRWRFTPLLRVDMPVVIKIDIFVALPGRGLMQLRTVVLRPDASRLANALIYEHLDHSEPLEVRLSAVGDGRRGIVMFSGVDVAFLGPCDTIGAYSAEPLSELADRAPQQSA
jgi:hypothetical protein